MRRKDRQITNHEASELLNTCEYGVLSTVSDNGEPYGIPLSYCVVNNFIYFHSAINGRKLDNIKNNESVSFCVVGNTEVLPEKFSTKYESAIVSGTIKISHGKSKQKGLEGLLRKYSPNYIEEGLKYIEKATDETTVLELNIESLTGKARK